MLALVIHEKESMKVVAIIDVESTEISAITISPEHAFILGEEGETFTLEEREDKIVYITILAPELSSVNLKEDHGCNGDCLHCPFHDAEESSDEDEDDDFEEDSESGEW